MKLAIVGSRNVGEIDISKHIPEGVTEIVSGGARGIDLLARKYAEDNNIKLTEFLPDYKRFGKGAPLKRNIQIADYADSVLCFWDGVSTGSKHVIDYCAKVGKPCEVVHIDK
jgi:predicted Rossmann fold nucleotide-binding protein DprA/Smf involved in DNA uptake